MRSIMKAILAALLTIPVFVWEGGKWVLRLLRPAAPADVNPAAEAAQEILDAQEERRVMADPAPVSAQAFIAWQQCLHIAGKAQKEVPGRELARLTDEQALWLKRLNSRQAREITARMPADLEKHWRRRKEDDVIDGVPPLPTYAAVRQAHILAEQAALRLREEQQKKRADAKALRKTTLKMLKELAEPDPA